MRTFTTDYTDNTDKGEAGSRLGVFDCRGGFFSWLQWFVATCFYPCHRCNPWFSLLLLFLSVVAPIGAQPVEKIVLRPAKEMTRADLYVWTPVHRPEGVIVLTPGTNGNGEGLIRQREWQEFARENRLALIGVSFASPEAVLADQRGYYRASLGSGQVLLDGIRKAFNRELPILLFGFSAGGHFTSGFVEWIPSRVVAWGAFSANWWDEPLPAVLTPPGIVGCGGKDQRLGAALIYFKQGRAVGRPWLWIELPTTGHECPPQLSEFVRGYFSVVLKGRGRLNPAKEGVWLDIDRLTRIPAGSEHPSVMAWLPEASLFEEWRRLNTP